MKSAEQNARAYYNDLGVPKTLPALIDSSYADRDFIMSVIYIYLAHLEKGLEKTYLADLARVFFSAGCFDMADSLFKAHLDKNPDDYIAMCDYAVVLAEEGKHIFARKTVQKRIDENKPKELQMLYNTLGLVRAIEYSKTDREEALKEAFSAFRIARFGSKKPVSSIDYGYIEIFTEPETTRKDGIYNLTLEVKHGAGSDAIVLNIGGNIDFGNNITGVMPSMSLIDIRDLFGTIYLPPRDSLTSEKGAFEIIGDLGDFAPFYEGRANLEILVLFPNGTKKSFISPPRKLSSTLPLGNITEALMSGQTKWADSILTSIESEGRNVPSRWRESVKLAGMIEDTQRWSEGLAFVDSIINIKGDPNLWVYKGALLYLLGMFTEAEEILLLATDTDPENFWAFYNLGLVEYDLGNKNLAIDYLSRSIEINPKLSQADLLIGVIYEELGENELALKHYRLALYNSSMRASEVESWIKDLEAKLGIQPGE